MARKLKTETFEKLTHFLKRRRTLVFPVLAAALTLSALLPHFQNLKFFNSLENSILSLRFFVRGTADPAMDQAKIVIVAVDDASLHPVLFEEDLANNEKAKLLGPDWPWDRSVHGLVAQRLFDAGASVVAFDFEFPTPNPGDWEFYEAIEANLGRLVLGFAYVPSENELGETGMQERLPYDDLLPLTNYESLLGFVNVERDDDAILRRAKLRTNQFAENQRFIDNPVQAERIAKRAQVAESVFALGAQAAILHRPEVREEIPGIFEYPVINYGGLDYFPTISYLDVVLEDRFERQKSMFRDAIVFVGPFSDSFKDVMATPMGDMYGVESHAHVARSLLNDSFYTEIRGGAFASILIALALALTIGNLRLHAALHKTGWTCLLIAGYAIVSQVCFNRFHLLLPVVPVLWVVGGAGAIFIVYDFALSQYERSKLKGYLSRYVSPEVAALLSEESEALNTLLTGASRPTAILFSDIRGFTTLSEQYTPVALVAHLNDYFESMVDSIHQFRGVLNKYIGDAILAVWGGLFSSGPKEDCINAVSSALDMERRMDALNARWSEDPEKLPLKIGIGISYGDAFVGNMGHSNRMEFAVMGDVVNLGSRLEGATKQYGCSILVSEEVYELCCDKIRFREIDIIQVKGKTKGVRTFEPINFVEEDAPSWLEPWNEALALYRQRRFAEAMAGFARLRENVTELAQSASLYETRCQSLITDPPPEDWDFVYVMQTK